MNQNAMLTQKPTKALILFSLPILAGNILQQLYSLIDTVIVGNYVSADALGAIGTTLPLVFMITCVSFGLANGASILIGQHYGAGESTTSVKTLGFTSLIYAVLIGLVLSVICVPNAQHLVQFIHTPANLQQQSTQYLSIYFMGLSFVFGFNMISAVFRSLGDSKTPLIFLGIASLLNIALDLLFVLGFQMGVVGVALATVIAQMVAFILQTLLFAKRMKQQENKRKSAFFNKDVFLQLTKLALPTTSQEILISVGIIVTQMFTNSFGSEVVNGYTATGKIVDFVMLPMINLGIGMTVFCAQNVGAKRLDRVKEAYHSSVKISLVFALIMAVIVVLFPQELMKIFLGKNITPAIFEAGKSYLAVSAVSFFFMAILFPAESVLKGAGDVHMFMIIAVTGSVAKIVACAILTPLMGYQGIWVGMACGWGVEAVLTLIRYYSGKWKDKRLQLS